MITKLSKKLSWLLRHGAIKEGVPIDSAGFIKMTDILSHSNFQNVTMELVKIVVEKNNKKRFELINKDDIYLIRAVQGHSIQTIEEKEIFEEITDPSLFPVVVHGTDKKAWSKFIRFQGLKKMARTHIHFAKGLPGDKEVTSGMRYSTEVIVKIDIAKAMKDGLKFFLSLNGVILCPGEGKDGVLKPQYFSKVLFKNKSKDKDSPSFIEVTPVKFKNILVLDFEANCIENGKLECQEIIEFPVVPVDSDTFEINKDGVFHQYIKPTVVPMIKEFCTSLTGITQDMVDGGKGIQECIKDFTVWLEKNNFDEKNSVIVTCGAWDLNTCLKKEAKAKDFDYPVILKRFINLKDIWQQVFFTKARGMDGMLKGLNLELEGKHHSGIDDSKNIAKIVVSLLKKGGCFSQFQEHIVKVKK